MPPGRQTRSKKRRRVLPDADVTAMAVDAHKGCVRMRRVETGGTGVGGSRCGNGTSAMWGQLSLTGSFGAKGWSLVWVVSLTQSHG